MERLLTPLVNRWLQKFVKGSQEGAFKASLSGGGGLMLHNLDLDLSSALPAGIESRRAFARSFRVKIPWTALNTQPIEVVFDTMEIVLCEATRPHFDEAEPGSSEPSAEADGSSSWLGGTSWLGSNLQYMIQRAGLNVSVTINNLVVKWLDRSGGEFALTVALEKLTLESCAVEEWWELVDNPEAWLKKVCSVKGLSISLDHAGPSLQPFMPLLCLSSLKISALLPIFSFLEGVEIGNDEARVAVEVDLGSIVGAANDRQLQWGNALVSTWRATAGREASPGEDSDTQAAGSNTAEAADPGGVAATEQARGASLPTTPQIKALGFFGKIWDYAVDEAEYLKSLESQEEMEQRGSAVTMAAPPTQAELTVNLLSLRLQLSMAPATMRLDSVIPLLEGELGPTQLRTASLGTAMQDVEVVVASLALRHNTNAAAERGAPTAWENFLGVKSSPRPPGFFSPATAAERSAVEMRWSSSSPAAGQQPACDVQAGQVWALSSPALMHALELCSSWISPPPPQDEEKVPPPLPSSEQDEEVSGVLPRVWDNAGIWSVSVAGVCVVAECSTAAAVLRTSGPISYLSKAPPGSISGLTAALEVFVTEDLSWKGSDDRSSLLMAAAISNVIKLHGDFNTARDGRVEFALAVFPAHFDMAGWQLDALMASIAANTGGGGKGNVAGALRWLTRGRISLENGLHVACLDLRAQLQEWTVGAESVVAALFVPASPAAEEAREVAVSLEITSLRSFICSSLEYLVSLEMASLDCGYTVGAELPTSHSGSPLALLTSLEMRGGGNLRHIECQSLNVAAESITMLAARALAANIASNPASFCRSVAAAEEDRGESGEGNHAATTVSLGMLSFTAFPPLAVGNDASAVGLTGWAAALSLQTSAQSSSYVVGSMEVALFQNSEGEKNISKALSFLHEPHELAIVATESKMKLRQNFSLTVQPMVARISPELIATVAAIFGPLGIKSPPEADCLIPSAHPPSQGRVELCLLHGRATLAGMIVDIVPHEPWGTEVVPSATLRLDEAFFLVHQDAVQERRHWFRGVPLAAATTVRASLMGVSARVQHVGPPGADSTEILLPADFNACVNFQPLGSWVLAVEAQALSLRASLPVLESLQALSNSLASHLQQEVQSAGIEAGEKCSYGVDDLRSGVFVLAGAHQDELMPLNVAVHRNPGCCSVEWCYPHPRGIFGLFLEDVPSGFSESAIEFSLFDEGSRDYEVVEVDSMALGKGVFLLPCALTVGQTWRLAWTAAAEEGGGIETWDLLQHLFINPFDSELWKKVDAASGKEAFRPSPLVAATTLAFSFSHVDISVLAAQTLPFVNLPGAHVLNALASLQADDVLAAVHRWETDATAVDVQMTAVLKYTEAATLRAATLIEEFTATVSYEEAAQPTQRLAGPLRSSPVDRLRSQAAGGFATMQDPSHLAVREFPVDVNKSIGCTFDTPLIVNFSELGAYDLLRMHGLITAEPASPLPPPIQISNATSMDLLLRQHGTIEASTVPAGSTVDFYWCILPQQQGDAAMALQMALANTLGSLIVHWSEPIEAMEQSGASIMLKSGALCGSRDAAVAVMVTREGPMWHVHIADGLRIYNRLTVPLDILFSKDSGPCFARIDSQKSADFPLHDGDGTLRCWLGEEWSSGLSPFREASDFVQVLIPDNQCSIAAPGIEHSERSSTMWNHTEAALLANLVGVDACSGHVVVAIWPPVSITNSLPLPLRITPPGRKARRNIKGFILEPSSTAILPVGVKGGPIASISLANDCGSHQPMAARALPIFCPPLGQNTGGSSSIFEDEEEETKDAAGMVFILSPGNAARVDVPYVAADPEGTRLPCYLLTDLREGLPGLSLRLLSQASIVNLLPFAVNLQVPGCPLFPVLAAGTAAAMNLTNVSSRMASLTLVYSQQMQFVSEDFPIDEEQELHLPLNRDTTSSGGHVDPYANLVVGVKIELKQVGTSSLSALRVIVSHGGYATNQTELALYLREQTTLENNTQTLLPGATVPILNPLSEYVEMAVVPKAGIDEPSTAELLTWYPVSLTKTSRTYGRVYYETSDETSTISYSTTMKKHETHVVLFRDPQPAVTLHNDGNVPFDISWRCEDAQRVFTVKPGRSIDFEVDADADLEEDEAFLTSIAPSDRHAYMPHRESARLLFKACGDDDWNDVTLTEGSQAAGSFNMRIARRGATMHAIIEGLGAQPNLHPDRPTFAAKLTMECLQFSFWDDERGRITGLRAARLISTIVLEDIQAGLRRSSADLSADFCLGALQCDTYVPAERSILWSTTSSEEDETLMASQVQVLDDGDLFWIKNVQLNLAPVFLDIDDSTFKLFTQLKTLLEPPSSIVPQLPQSAGSSETVGKSILAALEEEAKQISAPRLYIENLAISKLTALADIHLSSAVTKLPVSIDTARSPLSISAVSAHHVSLCLPTFVRGLTTHLLAEALLNAPLVLGSLQLFFNPTGLVHSIRRGVADLIDLPMQGLQQGPLHFIAGVGQGSVSLVKEISDWSVSSVVGFSRAASNALAGSIKRGSNGNPDTTSSDQSQPGSPSADELQRVSRPVYGFMRLAHDFKIERFERSFGGVVAYSAATDIIIYQGTGRESSHIGAFQLADPTLLLTTEALVLYSEGGIMPSLIAWLSGASVAVTDASSRIEILTQYAAPFTAPHSVCTARIKATFSHSSWAKMGPTFRRLRSSIKIDEE